MRKQGIRSAFAYTEKSPNRVIQKVTQGLGREVSKTQKAVPQEGSGEYGYAPHGPTRGGGSRTRRRTHVGKRGVFEASSRCLGCQARVLRLLIAKISSCWLQ